MTAMHPANIGKIETASAAVVFLIDMKPDEIDVADWMAPILTAMFENHGGKEAWSIKEIGFPAMTFM